MNRRDETTPQNGHGHGVRPEVPDDLRAADALLSEALAEWASSDAARAERIHRATVPLIAVPAIAGRLRPAPVRSAWRWVAVVGGGLAAAAMVVLVLRSGDDATSTAPAKAPVEVVEAPSSATDPDAVESVPVERRSAAEPVLVALIERDAGRWSEDWTADASFEHSSAWAAVVPVLETRDAGFDVMAGEVGAILAGGGVSSDPTR